MRPEATAATATTRSIVPPTFSPAATSRDMRGKRDPPQRNEKEKRDLKNPMRDAPYAQRGNSRHGGNDGIDPLVTNQVRETHGLIAKSEPQKGPYPCP